MGAPVIETFHRLACDWSGCSEVGQLVRFRVDAWKQAQAAGWSLDRMRSRHYCPGHTATRAGDAQAERVAAGLPDADGPVVPSSSLPAPAAELLTQVTGGGLYPLSIYGGGPGAIAVAVSPADLAHRDLVLERHAISEVARGHMRSTAMSIAEGRVALATFDRSHHART